MGDRGAGKSAIFRQLANDSQVRQARSTQLCPVANPGDLLRRIVGPEAWQDTDALRAAWLVVVAAVVAASVPSTASKDLRRSAGRLRTAVGLPVDSGSGVRKALRVVLRPFGGTTLKFSVGPVNLEAKLPSKSGGGSGRSSVDVEHFMEEVDRLLRESERRLVVMVDRIDETFKYDRVKQEAVVQALLQAESRVSQFGNVGILILIRTDLFELYDIQEKNKLISRTLTLDWTEEEWLQVLVRRLLANEPLERLAARLRLADGSVQTGAALRLLLPPEMEGQPIDRWLVDSLRNGNGDISPRLAVLLLHLAREASGGSDEPVSKLPLFTPDALGRAMTRVSELSFAEIVSDFKVASSFVLNCRAGKVQNFKLSEVENLFDLTEGDVSEQVRLLERLGFLERAVETDGSTVRSLFRIPKLYTRCWDYA